MSEQTKSPEQEVELNEEFEQLQADVDAVVEAAEQVEGEELSPEAEIALLYSELEAAKQTINDQKDSVVRAAADVENMRRRAAQDVEKAHKFALEKFANELLPVIDNLERAIEFSDKENGKSVFKTSFTHLSVLKYFSLFILSASKYCFSTLINSLCVPSLRASI